jgi:hypothetical protein
MLCESVPLRAVTVTWNMPAVPMQESKEVAAAFIVTIEGFREHVRPTAFGVAVRVTFPLNPLIGARLREAEPWIPELTVMLVEPEIAKSWMVYVTVAECVTDEPVAVMVTVYVPTESLQLSVELPVVVRVIVGCVREHARPVGVVDIESETVDENPF